MTEFSNLFSPIMMGDVMLPNRIAMAPLTRNRANSDGTPKDMAQTYYKQRSSAAFIISEATQISPMGKGYLDTPGIYNDDQVEGWKPIVDAVHANGGRLYCQLWHVGRISHTSLLPKGTQPVSSTNKVAESQTFTANGFEACSEPVALDKDGIAKTVADYRHAAECAKKAGFDGIELHSANGYLLDQFLQDGVNDREDEYGGPIENRMRFMMEALDAVLEVYPANRVGIRLSPLGQVNDMSDSNRLEHFSAIYKALDKKGLAYLHIVESFPGNKRDENTLDTIKELRASWTGFYIANGGYKADRSSEAIAKGHADIVAIGRPFIANPDLPERYRLGAELNKPDSDTFYGGDEKGYTDYPFLDKPTA